MWEASCHQTCFKIQVDTQQLLIHAEYLAPNPLLCCQILFNITMSIDGEKLSDSHVLGWAVFNLIVVTCYACLLTQKFNFYFKQNLIFTGIFEEVSLKFLAVELFSVFS